MTGVRAGRVCTSKRRFHVEKRSVLRMMAVMQDSSSNNEPSKEFLETGRTGRRNAMADILHPQGTETSTADLPLRLQQLVTSDSDPDNPKPGPSKTDLSDKKEDTSESGESSS